LHFRLGIADDAASLEDGRYAQEGIAAIGPAKPANFSQGIEAAGSRMIFVAGNVAVDAAGKTVAPGDIKGQTRQVLANIEKVLAEAGAEAQIADSDVMQTILGRAINRGEIAATRLMPRIASLPTDLARPSSPRRTSHQTDRR
jgi:enamine deaminase RidA (YjgF/YER057c/UK114 family)